MLYLFLSTVFHPFWLSTATWWKLHVVNKLSNSFTVSIIKNVTDYTLQESFVLKLHIFLLVLISFFMFGKTRLMLCFLRFGLWFWSDETVQISLRSVEFQGKIVFFEHFAHKFHTIILINHIPSYMISSTIKFYCFSKIFIFNIKLSLKTK